MKALAGHSALITGAASGLGLQTALGLARMGAEVLLVDRNRAGGEAALQQIASAVPGAPLRFFALDLASLAAIREFARQLAAERGSLDILVNNAGLLPPMQRAETAEGYELGFGVSVVGHYVLTVRLLPLLLRASAPRVVTLSSIAHAGARIPFDDIRMLRDYDPTRAYASAKLGALLFALELQRRAAAAGSRLISIAAHPGISRTGIGDAWHRDGGPRRLRDRLARLAMQASMRWLSQSAEQGAQPTLLAAATPRVQPGAFYGPGGFQQFRGAPRQVQPKPFALDPQLSARLWQLLEEQTGERCLWS